MEWLKSHLVIDHWREMWGLWSVRLAALASAVVAYILATPDVLLIVIAQLPPEVQMFLPPAAGLFLFVGITLIRLWRQWKPNG